jgi:hypothetical protein
MASGASLRACGVGSCRNLLTSLLARLTAPDKFNSKDSSVRIEVGNKHFATSRLISQLIAVIQLPVSKTDVAGLL